MLPFSALFLLCPWFTCLFFVGWCFPSLGFSLLRILLGFPMVVLLWVLASSLPVSMFLGFPFGLWALFCLGRISGSLSDGVLPLAESVACWVFCAPSSSLVLHMPFGRLCVGSLLLLSFSSSSLSHLYRWVFSSWGFVLLLFRGFPVWVRSRCLLRPSMVFTCGVSHWSFFCSILGFHFLTAVPPWCCSVDGRCLPSCLSMRSLP